MCTFSRCAELCTQCDDETDNQEFCRVMEVESVKVQEAIKFGERCSEEERILFGEGVEGEGQEQEQEQVQSGEEDEEGEQSGEEDEGEQSEEDEGLYYF